MVKSVKFGDFVRKASFEIKWISLYCNGLNWYALQTMPYVHQFHGVATIPQWLIPKGKTLYTALSNIKSFMWLWRIHEHNKFWIARRSIEIMSRFIQENHHDNFSYCSWLHCTQYIHMHTQCIHWHSLLFKCFHLFSKTWVVPSLKKYTIWGF